MKDLFLRFIGIDLGKRSMEVHIIDSNEKHSTWNCQTDTSGRLRLLSKLKPTDIIAMEACPLAFILYTMIKESLGSKVFVLNPLGLAMIYKSTKKTDREDAAKLAWVIQRLPEEELPIVIVPSKDEQNLRYLVAEQVELTQNRTREINRLHALFTQDGITTIKKKDLVNSKSRERKYSLLSASIKERALRYEKIIYVLEENLENVETQILKEVSVHERTPFLLSIPGVGPNLIAAYLGYLGTGERFTANTITAYAGLLPRLDYSGESNKYGPITKRGCPILRRAIVQAAWALVRSKNGGCLQNKYFELKTRKGYSKALVAIARKLLKTMWLLSTRKTMYLNLDPAKYRAKLDKYEVRWAGVLAVA